MPRKISRAKLPLAKPIGILGGGQLARMMALKAHEMGVPVAILSEKNDDPAAQVVRDWVQGDLKNRAVLAKFLNHCSVVTFESEFLDAELLAELEKETKTPILPRPQDMGLVQDRLTQKSLLIKNRLPTAEFFPVSNLQEAEVALENLGGKAVFKKRRFGYDGYGTFVIKSRAELFDLKLDDKNGFIAEKLIPFKRELAVMVARSTTGETLRLPFVETFQENSRCLWVKGPLRESAQLKKLGRQLETFLNSVGYVGIMGVELFDTGRELLINELAPRVHNSGHYSLDALATDQFSIHVKAVLGQELGQCEMLSKGFAMLNLLGQSSQNPTWILADDVHFHWYGKKENRPGRKMGHINSLASTPEKALQIVKKRRRNFDV